MRVVYVKEMSAWVRFFAWEGGGLFSLREIPRGGGLAMAKERRIWSA